MNTNGISHGNASAPDFAVVIPRRAGRRPKRLHSSSQPQRRVLFISYAFPPTGGGGVQRAVKFTKYLSDFGWQPTVLTVANPSVPVQDSDLAGDLGAQTEIVRARTWEPGYGMKKQLAGTGAPGRVTMRSMLRRLGMQLLQPDPQVLWNLSAFRQAATTLQMQPHDAILVTGPPFSSFLLGCKLKQRFGIPLVLDFRDEWMLVSQHMENHQLRGLAYQRQRAMMQKALRAADAVVATTQASAAQLASYCREAQSAASVSCIYNGFDPDDLKGLSTQRAASPKLRIVYTGTLWKLTDISPLVLALESLHKLTGNLTDRVELTIAGRRTPQQDAVLARLQATGVSLVCRDYLPHNQSLKLAAAADILLLLLADQAGAERVVPAKLFEYLALQVPILAISPEGETNHLLRHYGQTDVFEPVEIERLVCWLRTQLEHRSPHRAPQVVDSDTPTSRMLLARFARPHLTGEMANVLQQCVAVA